MGGEGENGDKPVPVVRVLSGEPLGHFEGPGLHTGGWVFALCSSIELTR